MKRQADTRTTTSMRAYVTCNSNLSSIVCAWRQMVQMTIWHSTVPPCLTLFLYPFWALHEINKKTIPRRRVPWPASTSLRPSFMRHHDSSVFTTERVFSACWLLLFFPSCNKLTHGSRFRRSKTIGLVFVWLSFRLATPPGLHVTHIPYGNLVSNTISRV